MSRAVLFVIGCGSVLSLGACADDEVSQAAGGGGASTASLTTASSSSATGGAGPTAVSVGSGGAGGDPGPRCGDGTLDPGEACDDGNDSRFDGCLPDCTVVAPLDPPPLTWTWVEVPGTQCMNGQPAGFGISKNPDSDKVMIYLEGGGACFNDACDFSSFSIPFVPPFDGIFNRANVASPVADWSMIYVPYCTGDIHGGDADTMLGGQVRHFRGYRNISAYLEQWVPTFADASTVLLTGISAGGFGAGLNFGQVADAFGPGPQMVLVDDSGPPLSNAVIAPCLQQTFREVWGLDGTILAECGADCPDPNDFASGYLAHLDRTYPDARVGVFSNAADLVIRTFMGFGWCDGQRDDCEGLPTIVPPNVYEDGLLELRASYVNRSSTFFVGQDRLGYNFGLNHTVLRTLSYDTTIIDGVSVPAWLTRVIDGEVVHVGP